MEKTSYDDLDVMEDCHFYALSKDTDLLYIGMTWDQFIQQEVKKTVYLYNAREKGIKIWLGYITEIDYNRLSKKIIQDIESLLIRYHIPKWNVSSTKNYTGRDKLIVKNEGFDLLEVYLRVDGEYIYTY